MALMVSDSSSLPADVTHVIFRGLYLSMEENRGTVYLLESKKGVSIEGFIADHLKTYELIASTLEAPTKPRLPRPIKLQLELPIPRRTKKQKREKMKKPRKKKKKIDKEAADVAKGKQGER